jgi:hypothetical protein
MSFRCKNFLSTVQFLKSTNITIQNDKTRNLQQLTVIPQLNHKTILKGHQTDKSSADVHAEILF